MLLALDLGTNTGWAVGAPGRVASGTQSFAVDRFTGGGMRFLKFRQWLGEMRALSNFDEVAFEEVRRHVATDAAHVYGGLLATLTSWCEEHGVPYAGVHVGVIKRHATGKGNASKQAVIDAVKSLGYAPRDDNEADALALFTYWTAKRGAA